MIEEKSVNIALLAEDCALNLFCGGAFYYIPDNLIHGLKQ